MLVDWSFFRLISAAVCFVLLEGCFVLLELLRGVLEGKAGEEDSLVQFFLASEALDRVSLEDFTIIPGDG